LTSALPEADSDRERGRKMPNRKKNGESFSEFFTSLSFFPISFWLLVAQGAADLIMGINLNLTGPSCWSGFAV
jgi:hypothetical protein